MSGAAVPPVVAELGLVGWGADMVDHLVVMVDVRLCRAISIYVHGDLDVIVFYFSID